jgi:hypothetical protein
MTDLRFGRSALVQVTIQSLQRPGTRVPRITGPRDTGLSRCHQEDAEELDRTRNAKRTYANTESGFGIDDK